jgi:hypothetical protein
LTAQALFSPSMATPSGHLNALFSIGEKEVGLKSGLITVTLPPNLPMRGAARVPTSFAPPGPALVTQSPTAAQRPGSSRTTTTDPTNP